MPGHVAKAIDASLTPLIIDSSESGLVDTFFNYGKSPYDKSGGCVILDAKRMCLSKTLKKMPLEDVLEEFRKPVYDALSVGKCLAICCSKSVPNFSGEFNGKDTIPLGLFAEAGKALLGNTQEFFRDSDECHGASECMGTKFAVVVTTQFDAAEYEEYLFADGFGLPKPFAMYQPIIIEEG